VKVYIFRARRFLKQYIGKMEVLIWSILKHILHIWYSLITREH
jgi:hypothetical protein